MGISAKVSFFCFSVSASVYGRMGKFITSLRPLSAISIVPVNFWKKLRVFLLNSGSLLNWLNLTGSGLTLATASIFIVKQRRLLVKNEMIPLTKSVQNSMKSVKKLLLPPCKDVMLLLSEEMSSLADAIASHGKVQG